MDLHVVWFVLIAVLYAGFFFLEGFDFGVGMLLPFLASADLERRAILNAIGPHWDGNEVWLITAAGATFAAFPLWYAALFSGFYPLLFLLLVALILRGVAFEFRGRVAHPKWRGLWDWAVFGGSLVPSFLLGVVFANIARGIPVDANGTYTGGVFTLLNPYGLLGGLALLAAFMLHGADFLVLKLTGDLRERAHAWARRVWPIVVFLVIALMLATYATTDIYRRLGLASAADPILATLAILSAGWALQHRKDGWAFALAAVTVVLTQANYFLALFPRVLVSSTNPDYSLTIYNASSSPYTLRVMAIVALTFVPVVLAYQIWSYWVFRHRIKAEPQSLIY